MDQPGVLRAAAATACAAALSLSLAACGGGGGTKVANDAVAHQPRAASVNYSDPPPPIAAAVLAAAQTAGCTAKGWASEANPSSHTQAEAATTITLPPLSGAHNPRWADWGFYDKFVPYKYQLHNLEHGGVFVHYGTKVPAADVEAIKTWWAASPAYLVVTPDTNPTFPSDAVVVGSQQRWLVCKPFKASQITAVDAFVKEYRGRGPEQVAAINSSAARPADLPAPSIPDPGAKGR